MHDPTVSWGLQNVGHVLWSDLEAIDRQGVLEQAKDFGLMNGVTLATVAYGSRSIASFARADRDYDEAEIDALSRGFADLHLATLGLDRLSASDRQALTELSIRLTH